MNKFSFSRDDYERRVQVDCVKCLASAARIGLDEFDEQGLVAAVRNARTADRQVLRRLAVALFGATQAEPADASDTATTKLQN